MNNHNLPPVGSTVRIDKIGRSIWPVAEMFIGADVTLASIFMTGDTLMVAVEHPEEKMCCCFRADMVRTPEKIAADDRKIAVQEMGDVLNSGIKINSFQSTCEALYDAGYRRVEK